MSTAGSTGISTKAHDDVNASSTRPVSTDTSWLDGELLGFDLETTGVDVFSDVPVSFAIASHKAGERVSVLTSLVDPGREILPGATAIHGITTERAHDEGIEIAFAIEVITAQLLDASLRGIPVVGMNVAFDLSMLDACSRRYHGAGLYELGWNGPVLDPLVLDRRLDKYRKGRRRLPDLCEHYGVRHEVLHDAVADVGATLDVLLAICDKYPWLGHADLGKLHDAQARWRRSWATSYSGWRETQGLDPLHESEYAWPIRSATAASVGTAAASAAELHTELPSVSGTVTPPSRGRFGWRFGRRMWLRRRA